LSGPSLAAIPIPPLKLRERAGPTDPAQFDNPTRLPIYTHFDVPSEAYTSVFDFGCGCGRVARLLLLQDPRPRRYIGVDIARDMIAWCQANLSPVDAGFQFLHHDVYSPSYGPRNSLRLSAPLPAGDEEFSLVVASSVFTHLTQPQTEYYLGEIARILKHDGVAFTSWFCFDNASFPFMLEGPFTLYTSETDFSQAVIYDRRWLVETLHRVGLRVRSTTPPSVPGHQWILLLEKRTPGAIDNFPLGEDAAEWVCGAPVKTVGPFSTLSAIPARPPQPPLFGALALLDAMKRSRTWRVGRAVTSPWRMAMKWLGRYDDVHGD
jgi:SAM-dependent methyltransferase